MKRTIVFLLICGIIFISIIPKALSTEISLGVEKGNWIEYDVTYSGTPPETHLTWIKIRILDIGGTQVEIEVTMQDSDGTQESIPVLLDFETGELGDAFIIPANLDVGETFYHISVGNITIDGSEERIYAGAKRETIYTTISQATFYWDKTTGFLLEGISTETNYTFKLNAVKTNMWATPFFGLDPFFLYLLIIASIVIIILAVFFIYKRLK